MHIEQADDFILHIQIRYLFTVKQIKSDKINSINTKKSKLR